MLSKEARQAIEIAKSIKAQQTTSLHAGEVAQIRENTDKQTMVDVPDWIRMEPIDQVFKAEWYRVEDSKQTCLLFLHGGGYITGSVKSRRHLCFELMKRLGYDGLSVDYRQWPEAKHPAAQEDVVSAYQFLLKKYAHVIVFGESAGATLALTLTLQQKDTQQKMPERIALFSPVITQLNIMTSEFLNQERDPMLIGAGEPVPYFDNPADTDPLVSPIYGDYKGFPPVMINCGSEEVKYDDSVVLKYLCENAGVDVTLNVWQDLFHVFVLFDMPETDRALDQIGNFLRLK